MKALVLKGSNRNFSYEESWPYPDCPQGWAVVKVAYSGICGSDLPRFGDKGAYHYPVILGHEFSGEVVHTTVGEKIKVGDKVAILPLMPCMECKACKEKRYFHCKGYQFIGSRNDGGFAEYCAVKEENLFRLPPATDLAEGSLLEPALVGLHTVRRSCFKPDSRAIVFGAGPIGLMIASWLRVLGASEIVISDLREYSLNIAKEMGFTRFFNPQKDDLNSLGSFDYSFEAAGAVAALKNAIQITDCGGTVTVVGRDVNDTVIPLGLFESFMRKEVSLLGCWGYKIDGEEQLIYECFENKKLCLDKFITHIIEPHQAVDMIGKMLDRAIDYCKVVIKF